MYQWTSLFLYKFQFLAELLIAEGIFCVSFPRRSHFWWRFPLGLLLLAGLVYAIPIADYGLFYQTFLFLGIFALSIGYICFVFEEPFLNLLFLAVAGYAVQHIAFCCYQFFMVATLFGGGTSLAIYGKGITANDVVTFLSFYLFILFYAVTYLGAYFLWGRSLRKEKDFMISNRWLFFIAILFVFLAVFLNSVMITKDTPKDNQTELLVGFAYGILSCLLVLVVLFKIKEAKQAENELAIVEQLWREDKAHYELAKENIDIINIKCHDLKHQLAAIRLGESKDLDALKGVENSIMIYGAMVKTGNDALDVLLSEKTLFCGNNGISLTYIVDGERLAFMSYSSIYSLFGNALDNAIEYVKSLSEDKRFIRLSVKAQDDMVAIHIENYLEHELPLEAGWPKTSKGDKAYHGFGLLSMRKIVEHYDGEIFLKTDHNLFAIDILLPSKVEGSGEKNHELGLPNEQSK